MKWSEKNPQAAKLIKSYTREWSYKPLILQNFSQNFGCSPTTEKGLKVLLVYSSLNQKISGFHLTGLIQSLFKRYSKWNFSFHEVPFSQLQKDIKSLTKGWSWDLIPKVPGILRSIDDFINRWPSLKKLVFENSTEEVVNHLSHHIFFMGKQSTNKYKARYFIWLCLTVFGAQKVRWEKDSKMPLTEGATRLLYFVGPLKGMKKRDWDAEQKLKYYNQFLAFLNPQEPWKPFAPLDNFQKRSLKMEFECQILKQGCKNCVLDPLCNP